MSSITFRTRTSSHSDTHISQCGCHYCDGSGHLMLESRSSGHSYTECRHCEGTGFLAEESTLPVYAEIILVAPQNVKGISNDYTAKENTDPADPIKQAA